MGEPATNCFLRGRRAAAGAVTGRLDRNSQTAFIGEPTGEPASAAHANFGGDGICMDASMLTSASLFGYVEPSFARLACNA